MNGANGSQKQALCLSPLPHLWLIDVDGTILLHNGHLTGNEVLLPGVLAFWQKIPDGDAIILLSARPDSYREQTLSWISSRGLRFDHALFDMPVGERVLINDRKASGLQTALAVNLLRNAGLEQFGIHIDPNL